MRFGGKDLGFKRKSCPPNLIPLREVAYFILRNSLKDVTLSFSDELSMGLGPPTAE